MRKQMSVRPRQLEKKANYEGTCKNKKFNAEILFKDKGRRFEGTGKDEDEKDFKIEGDVEP